MPRPTLPTALRAAAACLAGLVLAAAGCAGGGVHGYVTRGGISTVTLTAEDDARVSDPGIGGVEVRVVEPVAGGPDRVLGRAVSGTDGAFRIRMSAGQTPTGLVRVAAEREGYVTARAPVYMPESDEIWLVLLQQRGAVAPDPDVAPADVPPPPEVVAPDAVGGPVAP